MDFFNHLINGFFQGLFAVLNLTGERTALILISVLSGILMLLLFKKTSNQEALRRVKNRIAAHILELRLYRHSLRLTLKAIAWVSIMNLRYLGHVLRPLVVLTPPMLLVLIQLAARYESAPAEVGRDLLLSVTVADGIDPGQIVFHSPSGIKSETPSLWNDAERSLTWRLKPLEAGGHTLLWTLGSDSISSTLWAGRRPALLSRTRARTPSPEVLLNPSQDSLPAGMFFTEIKTDYPGRNIRLAGLQIHWLWVFLGVSIIFGFAVKGLFGVTL